MSSCVTDHGRKGAAKLFAIALVATMLAAPIASSWHELTVRHVRCAEHGELTHVPTAPGLGVAPARSFASVDNPGREAPDAHDHCSNGFIVRGRLDVSFARSPVRWAPPPVLARAVAEVVVSPGRAFVLASAPKTSPPAA
jgi:hypothetical protein